LIHQQDEYPPSVVAWVTTAKLPKAREERVLEYLCIELEVSDALHLGNLDADETSKLLGLVAKIHRPVSDFMVPHNHVRVYAHGCLRLHLQGSETHAG
jgi:hypothetical protein